MPGWDTLVLRMILLTCQGKGPNSSRIRDSVAGVRPQRFPNPPISRQCRLHRGMLITHQPRKLDENLDMSGTRRLRFGGTFSVAEQMGKFGEADGVVKVIQAVAGFEESS